MPRSLAPKHPWSTDTDSQLEFLDSPEELPSEGPGASTAIPESVSHFHISISNTSEYTSPTHSAAFNSNRM